MTTKRVMQKQRFLRYKTKFSKTLKSRNHTAQINEMHCKIIAYNITVLSREFIEMGADPESFSITNLNDGLYSRTII